ncbi:MAG: hypothetical protein OEM99_13735, partial [Gammaproteobacteria bacterium]|nr:hypothetical protein [Gammaproteobacteria bacterium]
DRVLEAVPGLTAARLMKVDSVGHNHQRIVSGWRDEEYPGEAQDVLAALREEYDLAWRLSQPGNQRDILDLERTLFSNDWSRLPAKIRKAMQPGECTQLHWTADVIPQLGWAEQVAAKAREALACDPMEPNANAYLVWSLIWAGDAEGALQGIEQAKKRGVTFNSWDRYVATLAAGRAGDAMAMAMASPGNIELRKIERETLVGDTAMARQMATEYWSKPNVSYWSSLAVAATVGDREKANQMAALIDAFPGSAVVLSVINSMCFCGAMFDLEAAPNYKARIEEADFPWPPPKRIDFPIKTW